MILNITSIIRQCSYFFSKILIICCSAYTVYGKCNSGSPQSTGSGINIITLCRNLCFGMAVVGDQIAIALNTGYYLFAMPWEYKEIDKMSLENSKEMVRQIMSFAQKLENAINSKSESESM